MLAIVAVRIIVIVISKIFSNPDVMIGTSSFADVREVFVQLRKLSIDMGLTVANLGNPNPSPNPNPYITNSDGHITKTQPFDAAVHDIIETVTNNSLGSSNEQLQESESANPNPNPNTTRRLSAKFFSVLPSSHTNPNPNPNPILRRHSTTSNSSETSSLSLSLPSTSPPSSSLFFCCKCKKYNLLDNQ